MSNIESEVGPLSLAEQTRQVADIITSLGNEVVGSFHSGDAGQRVHHLQHIGTEILFRMLPVNGWIERNRSRLTAELVMQRLNHVLREAVECSRFDIPEYLGGVISLSVNQHASEGARRNAEMVVYAKAFAESLRGWANDFDAQSNTLADDPTAYRPAKEFIDDRFPTYKAINKALDDNPWIHRQRPTGNYFTSI